MCSKRILVVDDEEDICEILRYNLVDSGFDVETASSAEEALEIGVASFNLLLLDVMMEGMSGLELALHLKSDPATSSIPIIFITARSSEDDRVEGLDLGADDYISKPFSVKEVLSRVKAVLRRTSQSLDSSGFVIDDERKLLIIDGTDVCLTKIEFDILKLLYSTKGRVYSREEILSSVWNNDVIVTERTVDVNITRLRKKLGKYGHHLVARHGFGYYYE